MNFLSVKDTVQKATVKAAQAAQKLSLNEMARNDEYIHSDGLKIHNKNHNHTSTNRKKKNEDILRSIDQSNHEISMMGSQDSAMSARSTNNSSKRTGTGLNHKNHNNYDDDDDDSVDSYDQENDPILQFGKSTNNTKNRSRNSSNMNMYQQYQDPHSQQETKKKKDPNRFMADLDARLAMFTPPQPPSSSSSTNQNEQVENPSSTSSPKNNVFDSFTKSENKLHWLRNAVASPQKFQESIHNVMKQVPGGRSMYDPLQKDIEMNSQPKSSSSKTTIKTVNGEQITVTTSSSTALFNNEENEEMQRLNALMNQSKRNICLKGLDLLEKQRHYAVVVITFILTMVGYWYSRKKNEENVT